MQALHNQYEFDNEFQKLREKGLVYDDEDGNHKFVDNWEEHQQIKNSLNPDWLQAKRDEMQKHHESKINIRKFQTQG